MNTQKGNITGAVIGIIALLIIIGALVFANNGSDEDAMMEEDKMMMEDDSMEKDDSMMEEDSMKDDNMMMETGSYEKYSSEKLAKANDGDVILFFKASWCPTCNALDSDIKSNLSSIPEGVTILELDYDTATELKKKYGVTIQHTLVQVDAEGNMITKWTGSPTLDSLVSKIQ